MQPVSSSQGSDSTRIVVFDKKIDEKINELVKNFEEIHPWLPWIIDFRPLLKKITYNFFSSQTTEIDQVITLLFTSYFESETVKISGQKRDELKAHWDRLLPILLPNKGQEINSLVVNLFSYEKITTHTFDFLIDLFQEKALPLKNLYKKATDEEETPLSQKTFNHIKTHSDSFIAPYLTQFLEDNSPLKTPLNHLVKKIIEKEALKPFFIKMISHTISDEKEALHQKCQTQLETLKGQATENEKKFASLLACYAKEPLKAVLKKNSIEPLQLIGDSNNFDPFLCTYMEVVTLNVTLNLKRIIQKHQEPQFLYEFTKGLVENGKNHLKNPFTQNPEWSKTLAKTLIDLLNIELIYPTLGEEMLKTSFKEIYFPTLLETLIDQLMDKTTLANCFVALLKESDTVYNEALKNDHDECLENLKKFISSIQLEDPISEASLRPLINQFKTYEETLRETLEKGTERYEKSLKIIKELETLQDRLERFIDLSQKKQPIKKEEFNTALSAFNQSLKTENRSFSTNNAFHRECTNFVKEFLKEFKNPFINKAFQIKKLRKLSDRVVGETIEEFLKTHSLLKFFDLGLEKGISFLEAQKTDPLKASFESLQAFKAQYIKKWHQFIDTLVRSFFSLPWHHFKRLIETFIRIAFGFDTSLDKILIWVEWIGELLFQTLHLTVGTLFYLILDRFLHFRATSVFNTLSDKKHKPFLILEIQDLFQRMAKV